MADEPIDITHDILRKIQEAIAEIKRDTAMLPAMRTDLNEVQVSVAALAVGQREIRASLDKIDKKLSDDDFSRLGALSSIAETQKRLAQQIELLRQDRRHEEAEARLKRIEAHLGLDA